MQKKDPTKQIWFTRREKQVRGPFPAGMITRHILLGRIVMDDELSLDQCNWHRVSEVRELIPEERLLDLNIAHNRQRLEQAIIRSDERNAGDRRNAAADENGVQFQRRAGDRRAPESTLTIMHRNISTNLARSLQPKNDKYRAGYFIILLLITLVLGLSLTLSKRSPAPPINIACSSIPAPAVNWSNCFKQNKDLQGMNLASANLSHGSFQQSNFSGATLLGANLEYANLSAIIASRANLQSAHLAHAILSSANLNGGNLSRADLRFAVLANADLRGADLSGADLTLAVLNQANIEGAVFDGAILDKTIWVNNAVCKPQSVGTCQEVDSSQIQSYVLKQTVVDAKEDPLTQSLQDQAAQPGPAAPSTQNPPTEKEE